MKAIYELALVYESHSPMPIKAIAQKTGFSDQYLEQIFASLKKADLIVSIRGAQGGYLLSRDPKDISVGDVVRCLDGPVEPAVCVSENEEFCGSEETCVTRIVWKKLKNSIDECLDSISLKDMLENNIE